MKNSKNIYICIYIYLQIGRYSRRCLSANLIRELYECLSMGEFCVSAHARDRQIEGLDL